MDLGSSEPVNPTYRVVWPLSKSGVEPGSIAPRLASLDGATIGFVWDYMFRGDELFPVLDAELRRRFPGLTTVHWDAFGNTHGPDEHAVVASLPDYLRAHYVDAVVSAVGC
jgi:hypothetical protein